MLTTGELADQILSDSVFTRKAIDSYGNWRDIPKETAYRLSEKLRLAMERRLAEWGESIATGYAFYPGEDTRSLLKFSLPKEPIKLCFDPVLPVTRKGRTKSDYSDAVHVRQLFKRRVARNLWLAIKPGHITSQHFITDVERFATLISRHKPRCWHDLYCVLSCGNDPVFGRGLGGLRVREMALLLMPYVTGEKDFKYEIAHEQTDGR